MGGTLGEHQREVAPMSDEPVIAASAAGKDTNEFFIVAARASCEMSIKNTGVGRWLGQALDRLEKSEAENERLREALRHYATEDFYIAHENKNYGTQWVIVTIDKHPADMARKALEGGGDDE